MENGREGDRSPWRDVEGHAVLMALKMANFQDDLRRAALQVNCEYIDYDIEALNDSLTPNNCRSTGRSSLLAAPLASRR